jgi:hypothetical protein
MVGGRVRGIYRDLKDLSLASVSSIVLSVLADGIDEALLKDGETKYSFS